MLKPTTRALITAAKRNKRPITNKSAVGRKGYAKILKSNRRLLGNKAARTSIIKTVQKGN